MMVFFAGQLLILGHVRYYYLFGDPSLLVCGLLLLQATLITFQVLVIAKSQFWYHLISQVLFKQKKSIVAWKG